MVVFKITSLNFQLQNLNFLTMVKIALSNLEEIGPLGDQNKTPKLIQML